MMNKTIREIVDKALGGGEIGAAELRALFAVDYLSEESYLIQYASRKMSDGACKGKAEVHAQVGLNSGSCPRDCQFCSFAAMNKIFTSSKVRPLEEIIESCLNFEAGGANAIYLMATATYKFADFLKVGREVKQALKTAVPLIANVGDFDEDEARALKKSGFDGIYHAVRLGEGVITKIDPRKRLQTIDLAAKAGLKVGTCLEPVGPEHTLEELVEKTLITRDMKPAYSGAGRRVNIPGSPLAAHGSLSYAQMAPILAAVRLAVGYDVVGNCTHEPNKIGAMAGASLLWAEVGSNPRDTSESTVRGWTVKNTQEVLTEAGWEVLEGPSVMFGASA
nr:radical SAM protein [Desulfitobacterium hafniense]